MPHKAEIPTKFCSAMNAGSTRCGLLTGGVTVRWPPNCRLYNDRSLLQGARRLLIHKIHIGC